MVAILAAVVGALVGIAAVIVLFVWEGEPPAEDGVSVSVGDRWMWATEGAAMMPNGVAGVTRTSPEPRFDYARLGEEQLFLTASQAPAYPTGDLLSEQPVEPVVHVGTLEATGDRVFIHRHQDQDGTLMFCLAIDQRNGTSTNCTSVINPGLEWGGSSDGETLQVVYGFLPDNAALVTITNGDQLAWTQRPIAGIAVFEISSTQLDLSQVTTAVALDANGETIATMQPDFSLMQ